jgi:hypothetical protein
MVAGQSLLSTARYDSPVRPAARSCNASLAMSTPVCSHLDQVRVTALPETIAGCAWSWCYVDEVAFVLE